PRHGGHRCSGNLHRGKKIETCLGIPRYSRMDWLPVHRQADAPCPRSADLEESGKGNPCGSIPLTLVPERRPLMSQTNLPPDEASQPAWVGLKRLVKRFDDAWQGEQQPLLAAYLPVGSEERRSALVELIPIDLTYRQRAGEAVRIEEYFGRYPELLSDPE